MPAARALAISASSDLAGIERDIDRIELDERVERTRGRADQRSFRRLVAAEAAGEGRADFGVAEIEPRRLDRRAIDRQRRLGLAHRALALVVDVLGDEAALRQLLAAGEIGLRVFERRGVPLRPAPCA